MHRATWLDGVLIGLVLLLAFRGYLLGTFAQLCSWVGAALAVLAMSFVYGWVGAHWTGARPALVFGLLQGACALVSGAFLFALAQWAGVRARVAIDATPWRAIDRTVGIVFGAGTGLLLGLTAICLILLSASPPGVRAGVAHSISASPLLRLAHPMGRLEARLRAGRSWLGPRLEAAERRLASARSQP